MNKTALTLIIVGALNWLLVGLFRFDLVASLFGGSASLVSRIIYVIIGLAGLYSITLLFSDERRETT
ncbi:MAG: DUF378 domain-containing protein [Alicyclobacillus sp. RIFOXYA1_FULL_53_8]|nr:MAG: DUF378 domain-containing protein [Alicyclobacillus sp. RIFOXYA1_FULL_53_8]